MMVRVGFGVLAVLGGLEMLGVAGLVPMPQIVLLALPLVAMVVVPGLLLKAKVLICDPYVGTVVRMEGLAAGDLDSPIDYADHTDCVGRMTKAMDVFRAQAALNEANRETLSVVVRELGLALEAMARGDLSGTIHQAFAPEFEPLRLAANKAMEDLGCTVAEVSATAHDVSTGSAEIRAATDHLAARTEEQASALNEAAQALAEITSGAKAAAGEAVLAKAVTATTSDATNEGAEAVTAMVASMEVIASSANDMGQIVAAIDGIAFQTNLLALNAGVEAARAGDAGRGFAVVASEVRALAARASESAAQIKALISRSQSQVVQGTDLARRAGEMLGRIAEGVAEVNERVQSMANSVESQSVNLVRIESGVRRMDQGTHSNAAMVEQTSACARNLAAQATNMAATTQRFVVKRSATGQGARLTVVS